MVGPVDKLASEVMAEQLHGATLCEGSAVRARFAARRRRLPVRRLPAPVHAGEPADDAEADRASVDKFAAVALAVMDDLAAEFGDDHGRDDAVLG